MYLHTAGALKLYYKLYYKFENGSLTHGWSRFCACFMLRLLFVLKICKHVNSYVYDTVLSLFLSISVFLFIVLPFYINVT